MTIAGLRADHVSILGYARDTTWFESGDPDRSGDRGLSFDDLAAQGVLFTRAFAASGDTDASLASLHLGRSPFDRADPPSGALAEDELTVRGMESDSSGEHDGPQLDWSNPLAGCMRGHDDEDESVSSEDEPACKSDANESVIREDIDFL